MILHLIGNRAATVQEPLPVTQGNSGRAAGLQQRCVSVLTPGIAPG